MKTTVNDFGAMSVLVTGANSGLGYEAAAQLAEAGFGRVVLACRTLDKARAAQDQLSQRVGSDPFEPLAVDVSSVESARAASDALIARAEPIDALLLNAGVVPGDTLGRSVDGLELAFASSIVGHHIMTLRLLESGVLRTGARVVIAGSEGARYDLPAMFGMQAYDFAVGVPQEFGDNLRDAMLTFARGDKPEKYDPMRYYAATKAFTSWWSAAMAHELGDRLSVFTVSPGSNMGTNAARHTRGFKKLLFTRIMPFIGSFAGMNMPTPVGAKRYVDVLMDHGHYTNGRSYMSKEAKITGPMVEQTVDHLLDPERQRVAFSVICDLTGAHPRSE